MLGAIALRLGSLRGALAAVPQMDGLWATNPLATMQALGGLALLNSLLGYGLYRRSGLAFYFTVLLAGFEAGWLGYLASSQKAPWLAFAIILPVLTLLFLCGKGTRKNLK